MRRAMMGMAAGLVLASGAPLAAQTPDPDHRFFIRGGAFITDMKTTVRLNALDLPGDGTEISFEDDLGLSEGRTIPSIEAGWRFAPDWIVSFEYFGIDRSRTVSLARTIEFEGSIFDVGADVTGRFRSNLYKVQVGWSPWRTEAGELGLTLGAHLTDFTVGIAGEARVTGDQGGQVRFAEERRQVLAPLPNFGAYGTIEVVPDLRLVGRLHWFSLRIDDYKGGLTDALLGAEWKFHRNLGVGGAWRILNYRLDIDDEDVEGRIRYRFNGPMIYGIATF